MMGGVEAVTNGRELGPFKYISSSSAPALEFSYATPPVVQR